MVQGLSVAFALVLALALILGMFALCWGLTNVFVIPVIRIFKPRFGLRISLAEQQHRPRQKETSAIANEYLQAIEKRIAERIKQESTAKARERETTQADFIAKRAEVTENSSKQVNHARIFHNSRDLWALARFPNGESKPQFLCRSIRGNNKEIRTAFANLPAQRITMDRESAIRWQQLLHGTHIVAANVYARVKLRAEQKQLVNQIQVN